MIIVDVSPGNVLVFGMFYAAVPACSLRNQVVCISIWCMPCPCCPSDALHGASMDTHVACILQRGFLAEYTFARFAIYGVNMYA